MHLLLQRAGFNRWYPRMQGKRNWFVVRKHLLAVAHEIETKSARLADILLIPEPFSLEDAAAIAKRRTRAMAVLLSPGEDVQFKLMLVLSELKEFSATDVDYRIVLRHMPDCPLYMQRKAGERFKKVFEREDEAWAHQRSAEQSGQADTSRLRFLFCGLIYAKREGVYFVDTATLVMLSSTWIPLDHPYEQLLIDELVRHERRFLKPLRFESKQGATFPNAVLLDTGDAETPLDIVTPFMSDRDRTLKQQALAKRAAQDGPGTCRRSRSRRRCRAQSIRAAGGCCAHDGDGMSMRLLVLIVFVEGFASLGIEVIALRRSCPIRAVRSRSQLRPLRCSCSR